jgi:WD40 repeat protein
MKIRHAAVLTFSGAALMACVGLAPGFLFPQTVHFKCTAPVSSVVSSPDGKTLALVSKEDRSITLWDVAGRRQKATLRGHDDIVYSVAFSPDGQLLASAGTEKNKIVLWDLGSSTARAVLQGHADRVKSVAFSPDGKLLASASFDKMVKLWDVLRQRERISLRGHNDRVTCVAFSPDGKTLASGGNSMIVKLWDVKTGKEQANLQDATSGIPVVLSLSFSPDGKTLATGDMVSRVNLWDVTRAKKLRSLEFVGDESYVDQVAFSPDGKTIAAVDMAGIQMWDVASYKKTGAYEYGRRTHPVTRLLLDWGWPFPSLYSYFADELVFVDSVAFRPDGKLTVFGTDDNKTVRIWALAGPRGACPSP